LKILNKLQQDGNKSKIRDDFTDEYSWFYNHRNHLHGCVTFCYPRHITEIGYEDEDWIELAMHLRLITDISYLFNIHLIITKFIEEAALSESTWCPVLTRISFDSLTSVND
jgi:hypothetical protein